MNPTASLDNSILRTRENISASGAKSFGRFVWFLIAYNLLVVMWGAFVRASKSGDGCGAHWPLCNGEVVPLEPRIQTVIEFTHRGMSGLLLFAVIGFIVWAFRLFPKGHAARRGAALTLFFTLTEAFIGAVLVKKGLVADNDSAMRAVVLSAHLVNTFLLLASLAFAAWASTRKEDDNEPRLQLRGQGGVLPMVGAGLFLTMWVSISGTVAALRDTLNPVTNFAAALREELSSTAPLLVKLKLAHPTLAISTAIFLVVLVTLLPRLRPSPQVQLWAKTALAIFCFQIGFGLLNVLNLAPIWMQIVHLLIADCIWISLVMMSYAALSQDAPRAVLEKSNPAAEKATWKDYALLTKPRVISLLIFTTWAAMVMAARGWPGFTLFALTGIGFYMAAGAAHVINMVIDRDIDRRTERTAKRAVAAGRISVRDALIFAAVLCTGSFLILWLGANLLAALMAFSGLAFYVIVYTLLLKRRTWSNIVIGGAAGAFPPLVGWAAVTGELAPLAWLLFGIIFLWTPVHFWALAILIKDDYAKNGIPMLPVVKGNRATAWQIVWYAVFTMLISLAPFGLKENGVPAASWIYLVAAIALNGVLIWRSVLLYRDPERPRASWLFHYSMLYLFLLFLALAVDRAVI
jgi:protoheme IX farnesyltransferase